MRYIFNFPDIGEGISEGVILRWYVERGQSIRSGDNLVQMETDKVVADIPSPRSGTVVSRFGKVGDTVSVGHALVEIEIEGVHGEDARKAAEEQPKGPSKSHVKEESFGIVGVLEEAGDMAFLPASGEGLQKSASETLPSKAMATPVARAMAKNLGVDINQVSGTGPRGRVTREDILRFHQKGGIPARSAVLQEKAETTEYLPLTQIRKTIAHRMHASKQNAAHMTVLEQVQVDSLVRLRDSQKERFREAGRKLTFLPFIIKATAEALKEHPLLNSRLELDENRIVINKSVNIGIAVDTRYGLMVPVISDADRLSITQLADLISQLAEKAADRKLSIDELKGGTFSITNFGAIGGLYGVPVINYPEVAILGAGRLHQAPVVTEGRIEAGWVLPLSLSVDHRVVDGGESTRFLQAVMNRLKDPVSMLLG